MKFSIVTISFNQAKFLRQCIDSVLQQREVELEYIVVDAGSNDGSREIIESYGSRIIRIFESDSGPADGLNKGFSKASGDIFGFINSDDYLLPGALATLDHQFSQHGLKRFVSGAGYIERDGRRRLVRPTKIELEPYLYGACTIFQQSTFFPAAMFRAAGGFRNDNRSCWDGELFLSFRALGFAHTTIDEPLAIFRVHDESISGSNRLQRRYEADRARMFEEHFGRRPTPMDAVKAVYWRALKHLRRLSSE